MHYFTWKLVLVSNILWIVVDPTGQIHVRGRTFPWYIPKIFGKCSLWNSGEYSQVMFREYYSWNIRGTFPWCIPKIFGKSSLWNSGEYSQIMFQEYCSWDIHGPFPWYSQNIRKKFPMKFQGIFLNNVPGILNIGIFPDCSMTILRMLHALF